jgi:hypothetical protein
MVAIVATAIIITTPTSITIIIGGIAITSGAGTIGIAPIAIITIAIRLGIGAAGTDSA